MNLRFLKILVAAMGVLLIAGVAMLVALARPERDAYARPQAGGKKV